MPDTLIPIVNPLRRRIGVTLSAVWLTAGVALVARYWGRTDETQDFFIVGVMLVCVGFVSVVGVRLVHLMCIRIRPLDDMWQDGCQVGYARGLREGRQRSRPTLVHVSCPHCGEDVRKVS